MTACNAHQKSQNEHRKKKVSDLSLITSKYFRERMRVVEVALFCYLATTNARKLKSWLGPNKLLYRQGESDSVSFSNTKLAALNGKVFSLGGRSRAGGCIHCVVTIIRIN
jgi:hypothetical protein